MAKWNLWHGCHKISDGCRNCYVYRGDAKFGRNSSEIHKTGDFDLPLRIDRNGNYKIPSGETMNTCFTSDFFLDDADKWREDAWDMIRIRSDLEFFIITKRISRYKECLPPDWGDGYDNVTICCTVENQEMADYRLPMYLEAPIKHKLIICAPLLEPIDLEEYLIPGVILQVSVSGESGNTARVCDYDWVLDIRSQCQRTGVPFQFMQTGALLKKDGKIYRIERKHQHSQARKANIDLYGQN